MAGSPATRKLPVHAGSVVEHVLRLASAVGAGLAIMAFHAVAHGFYDGLRVPQGHGMESLLPSEVMHYTLFVVFGVTAAWLMTVALLGTSLPASARRGFRAMTTRPWRTAAVCAVALTAACLLVSVEFLGDGILTDDEHVYRFIAQTLRTGSLTAPSPGADLEFFWEQFVVLTDKVRYGKYPIGFPILLAAGQVLRVERAVVPLCTGLLALLLAWVGLREFPPAVVVLALILFVLSPQVLLTGGASLLSQPLAAVCLMGALGCLVELQRGSRRPALWAAGAGVLLAYGILTRPLPTVLFGGVAVVALALGPRIGFARRLTAREWLALLVPMASGPAALLWINFRQSGHPFHSGYHAIHAGWGPTLMLYGTVATWVMSVVSHAVRLNFWLFGWPLSLALCVFARRTAFTLLCWGMIAAELVYRVLSPKAGVGHAGPLYVYEIVPILCLLSADGLFELTARARQWPASAAVSRLFRSEVLAAALISLTFVNLTLFLPFKIADVSRAAYGQQQVFRDLRQKGVHHAVVFHRSIVPPWLGLSWAYFPPPNPPDLDADVLFCLIPSGEDNIRRATEFWRRRFPDRQAWVFGWDRQTGPFLTPLTTFLAGAEGALPPAGSSGS